MISGALRTPQLVCILCTLKTKPNGCLRRSASRANHCEYQPKTKHLIPCFQYEFYIHQYKAYEGIVMTYLHKTKPNSRIESKKASKIESLIEKWTDENTQFITTLALMLLSLFWSTAQLGFI